MGSYTDARIAAFQEATGIKPTTGERGRAMRKLQETCFEIIRVLELELSGIRQGDGSWHGSDVTEATLQDLMAHALCLRAGVYDEREAERTLFMSSVIDELANRKWADPA